MPANDRFRSNEEEVPLPVEMQPPDQDPEASVPLLQPKSALRAERYLQLLTQKQVLNDQSRAGSKEGCERSDEQGEEIDHRGSIAAGPVPSGVFALRQRLPGRPTCVRLLARRSGRKMRQFHTASPEEGNSMGGDDLQPMVVAQRT